MKSFTPVFWFAECTECTKCEKKYLCSGNRQGLDIINPPGFGM